MTEREREFCRLCAFSIDAPIAAEIAGYELPTEQTAAALLERDDIRAEIQQGRELHEAEYAAACADALRTAEELRQEFEGEGPET